MGGKYRFHEYTGTTDFMAFIIIGSIVGGFVSAVLWGMGFPLKVKWMQV